MAVRIRKDGTIVCAARHPAMPGDTYLNDGIAYVLSVELHVLVTEPVEPDPDNPGLGGHGRHGRWWWAHEVPEGAVIDRWWEERAWPSGRPMTADELALVP